MDESQIPKLKRAIRHIVKHASEKGGSMERGTFTLASARAEVTRYLGFEKGALDGMWKKLVKDEVTKAMDALDQIADEGNASSSASEVDSPSPQAKRKKAVRKPKSAADLPSGRVKKGRSKRSPSVEVLELSDTSTPPPSKPKSQKPTSEGKKGKSPRRKSPEVLELDDASEMSSVYDEPPKKRGKRKSREGDDEESERPKKGSGAGGMKGRAKKDPNEGVRPLALTRVVPADGQLSRDEARVADLKRIVTACGTRKMWSKEFADAPEPKAQTSILQSMLKELGMEGKASMGKAKAIKEARELAAELNDVKEFEAARGRRSDKLKSAKAVQADEDDESEEPTAADAVMAFLQGEESD